VIEPLDILADHYQTTAEQILHRSHAKPETTARQVLCWFLVRHCRATPRAVASTLDCADSTVRYSVKTVEARFQWEPELRAICKRIVLESADGCGHPERFVARSGTVLCERCQEIAQGWKDCLVVGCRHLAPPDLKVCANHQTAWMLCGECDGEGGGDCEELDCHGRYCDLGVAECDACHGAAVVRVPAV
jgi:hypothetical protein